MSNQPTDKQITSAYALAKERYATLGVDVDQALATLRRIPLSLHCWQGDDVGGFENPDAELSGGIAATGNYPGKARTADELRGSSHLAAAARSILALSLPPGVSTTPDLPAPGPSPAAPRAQAQPDLGKLRRFEVIKTNVCRQPPPLGLIFEGQDMAVPTLRYTEYVEPPPPPSQLELCARWLLEYLAGGEPARPADVVRAARESGFSRRTLYRARQDSASR